MWTRLASAVLLSASAAAAQDPLSAIDWLEKNALAPRTVARPAPANEPPVSGNALTPDVTVTPLDQPKPDAVGLLPPGVTGFPLSLWQNSNSRTVVDLIRAQRVDGHPAIQALLYSLLLAEADPPQGAESDPSLLQARIDKLVDLGATDPALALLTRAGPNVPTLFQRWFDLSLLEGSEDEACRSLAAHPELSDDYAVRLFCLARAGDWQAAAATLSGASALDALSEHDLDLLARFLDPDLAEGLPPLPPPSRPTPLQFRLYEAIGEALPGSSLPRAFSSADLRGDAGWKPQLEAAERLMRSGAISENRLLGIYSAGPASAESWPRCPPRTCTWPS